MGAQLRFQIALNNDTDPKWEEYQELMANGELVPDVSFSPDYYQVYFIEKFLFILFIKFVDK